MMRQCVTYVKLHRLDRIIGWFSSLFLRHVLLRYTLPDLREYLPRPLNHIC